MQIFQQPGNDNNDGLLDQLAAACQASDVKSVMATEVTSSFLENIAARRTERDRYLCSVNEVT